MKFKEKSTGRTWYIHNAEHIKSFLLNKNFELIEEKTKVSNKKTKEEKEINKKERGKNK
jgi:hypothetical protein|nr:MAG TPA_asm: hypothetical protein [Caudoviricetes sp.]